MKKKLYGTSKEEELLSQAITSREIVKEILDYGVTQYQIAKLIQFVVS